MENYVSQSSENEPIPEVRTSVVLPVEMNDHNDCGPLSLEMILRTCDKKYDQKFDLGKLRAGVDKVDNQGTLPGNICKFLIAQGYKVNYFTTIPWKDYRVDFGENLENLPEKAKPFKDFIRDGFLPVEKIKSSAEWLEENPKVVHNRRLTYHDVANFLQEGQKVIVVAGGDHYIVVTGIDAKNVYFNNPDFFIPKSSGERVYFDTREQSLPHTDFEEWVMRNTGSTEAIVVSPDTENQRSERENIGNITRRIHERIQSQLNA